MLEAPPTTTADLDSLHAAAEALVLVTRQLGLDEAAANAALARAWTR